MKCSSDKDVLIVSLVPQTRVQILSENALRNFDKTLHSDLKILGLKFIKAH